MKNTLIILIFGVIFCSDEIRPIQFSYLSFSSEKSTFFGGSIGFIGKPKINSNLILDCGLGLWFQNKEWIMEYFSIPVSFTYRKILDDSFMFYDIGLSSDIMISKNETYAAIAYPDIGVGVKLNQIEGLNSFFVKNVKFSLGYNLINRDEEYYPNGIIIKFITGF